MKTHLDGTRVITDPELPDGRLDGYGATGALIVSLKYIPNFERLYGSADDEREVRIWHASPGGVRRIAAIAAWNSSDDGHPTAGNA